MPNSTQRTRARKPAKAAMDAYRNAIQSPPNNLQKTQSHSGQKKGHLPLFFTKNSWYMTLQTLSIKIHIEAVQMSVPTLRMSVPRLGTHIPTVRIYIRTLRTEFPSFRTKLISLSNEGLKRRRECVQLTSSFLDWQPPPSAS